MTAAHSPRSGRDNLPESASRASETSRLTGEINRCESLIEIAVLEGKVNPAECPLVHNFFPGLYARQIAIPARTLVTSRTHKTTHPFVVLSGDISVSDGHGNTTRFKTGHFGVTRPGTKRILFAHEDTVWVTFHPTNETDPDVIASQILEQEDLSHFKNPESAQIWKFNPKRDRIMRFGAEEIEGAKQCLLEQ